jgi:hypothetical protein
MKKRSSARLPTRTSLSSAWSIASPATIPAFAKRPYVAEKNASFPDQNEIEGLGILSTSILSGANCSAPIRRSLIPTASTARPIGTPTAIPPAAKPGWKAWATPRASPTSAKRTHLALLRLPAHLHALLPHVRDREKLSGNVALPTNAAGYLERAWGTAHAFFTYPYGDLSRDYYETYKWGLYNELVILKLADALDREGFPDRAAWLRAEWEKKVKYFVYDDKYPFRSEYAFDRTAFESTYAFAKYGATHDMLPDTNLWLDSKETNYQKWYSHPSVNKADSRAFMDRQLAAGLCVRGWLEASYYQLGADGGVSYMAAMGGWGILDYALDFAKSPSDWLQLGYASYLSSWCLLNTGPAAKAITATGSPVKPTTARPGWQFISWEGRQRLDVFQLQPRPRQSHPRTARPVAL